MLPSTLIPLGFLLALQLLLFTVVIRSDNEKARVFSDSVLWTTLSRDVTDFQSYIDSNDDITFNSSNIDGSSWAQSIAQKISYKLRDYASAVKRLHDGVVKSYNKSSVESYNVAVCGQNVLNATFDERFDYPVNTKITCTTKKGTILDNYNIDQLFEAMSSNLNANNSASDVKFQYFGREDGQCIVYPAVPISSYGYDPRFRPWYMGTAIPEPKDVVLIIDLTQSMTRTYSAGQRTFLNVAQEVTSTIIDTLNNGDRVGVIGFSDFLSFPSKCNHSSCYNNMLALATPQNKANLEAFIMCLNTSSANNPIDFTEAYNAAFQLLVTNSDGNNLTVNTTQRSKMVLLFTDGDINTLENSTVSDTLSLLKNIYDMYNISVDFHTFAFGSALTASASELLNSITKLNSVNSPGVNVAVKDPDNSRQEISPFVSYYAKSNVSDPVFTAPYTDAFGLGPIMSVCLPVTINDKLEGVTCADIVMNSLFSEVAYFQQSPLSYAFLVDDEGHVLLHPLLPQPQTSNDKPLVLDILDLERGEAAKEVKRGILGPSRSPGHKSGIANMYSPRGDDVSYGMDTFTVRVTYFWYPVNNSRFSICIVLADGLQSHTIQWKNTVNNIVQYPTEILCDSLNLHNTECIPKECNRLGSIAFKDISCMHIAPRGFLQPFAYLENDITFQSSCSKILTNILSGVDGTAVSSCPGDLRTQPGVPASTAATYQLDKIWKESKNPSWSYVIARYLGDINGVFRAFPGNAFKKDYDPTIRPWFVKARANPGKVIISAPYVDAGGAGIVLTVSRNVAVKRPNATSDDKRASDPIWAVSGLDFTLAYFYSLIKEEFGPCQDLECFVIDTSGFIVVHEKFFSVSSPVSVQSVHITTFEPDIAVDLIRSLIMTRSSCVRFDTIMKMNYWQVHLLPLDNGLHSTSMYDMYDIPASNIFIIVKKKVKKSSNTSCSCDNMEFNDGPIQCKGGTNCECPCYTKTGFDFCRSMFLNDEEVWGPCPWPTKPIIGSGLKLSIGSSLVALDATKFLPCYPLDCPATSSSAWQCEKFPSCQWNRATNACGSKIAGEAQSASDYSTIIIATTAVLGAVIVVVIFIFGCWKGYFSVRGHQHPPIPAPIPSPILQTPPENLYERLGRHKDIVSVSDQTIPKDIVSVSNQTIPKDIVSARNQTILKDIVSVSDQTIPKNIVSASNQTIPKEIVSVSIQTIPKDIISVSNQTIPKELINKQNSVRPSDEPVYEVVSFAKSQGTTNADPETGSSNQSKTTSGSSCCVNAPIQTIMHPIQQPEIGTNNEDLNISRSLIIIGRDNLFSDSAERSIISGEEIILLPFTSNWTCNPTSENGNDTSSGTYETIQTSPDDSVETYV